MLKSKLQKEARNKNISIIFPEWFDDRILKAVAIISQQKYANPILLGDPRLIQTKAKKLKINLDKIQIINILFVAIIKTDLIFSPVIF